MKVVILAGGIGTRGRPYTDYFPKAMIPINGRPLIDHITKYINTFNFVSEIVIVANFGGMGGQIKNYYKNRTEKIVFVQDTGRGTGRDILCAEKKLVGETGFVLWFVDNLCAIDLSAMRNYFRQKKSIACIATRTRRKEETGFAVVKDGMIRQFKEKPKINLQMSECLGIYMLQKKILDRIKEKRVDAVNLSYDILEPLADEGKVCAFDIGNTDWIDAESPVILERNKRIVQKITRQMERRTVAQTL